MKKLFFSVFLFITFSATAGMPADSLEKIISNVKGKFAPDKRIDLFKVEIRSEQPLILGVESTNVQALNEFKTLVAAAKIQADIKSVLLPSAELNGHVYGIANFSVCNNRFAPDNAAEMATQMLLGTPVEILKKEHGYYLVRTPDNYLSWTDDAGVEAMDKSSFNAWQTAERIVITAQYSHSYSEPSSKSRPVSDLVGGNILKLLGKKKKYFKVAYPDGRVAYVFAKDAAVYSKWISNTIPTAKQILNTATQLIGVPYLWGGTSVKAVDCSGFTKTCYFLNGIVLARDASQQVLYGDPVDIFESDTVSIAKCLQNLQPGDLLFFAAGKYKTENPRVTHTAIYMGGGKFIQSASMVKISSLIASSPDFDAYQSKHLVNAKRILSAIGQPGILRIDQHPFYNVKYK